MPRRLREDRPKVESAGDIEPYGDRVLVTEQEAPETYDGETDAKIYIPEPHRDEHRPTIARVLAMGPRCEADVEVGDRVLYGRFSGQAVETEDEGKCLLMPGKYLLAVLEGADE